MNFRRLLFRIQIRGESMWPQLIPGRAYWASSLIQPRPGRLVVFSDPDNPDRIIVKKIRCRTETGFEVGGTVSWSSSYHITARHILGCLVYRSPSLC